MNYRFKARNNYWPKTILLGISFLALSLFQVTKAGDWSSGGGDPIRVKAMPFPNLATLGMAIELLKEHVQASPFYPEFKQAFLKDLEILEKGQRFYYVPDLFSVGLNRFPGDYEVLVSNGAMTEYELGAPIYFSRQSVIYDAKTLARVIAQEIPHHIFTGKFQKDEMFVNTLGTYLIVGGEPPTTPVHVAQVIYEQFINKPGEALSQIFNQAMEQQQSDWRWAQAAINLASKSYKERGSYGLQRLGVMSMSREEFLGHKQKVELPRGMEIFKDALKKCVFVSYEDGASGITPNEQNLLSNLFIEFLVKQSAIIKNIYLLENIQLPTEAPGPHCAIALVGPTQVENERIIVLQKVTLHEDEVRTIQ